MQLDVRNYLKKVKQTENIDELEQELNELIDETRKYRDPKYDESPILQWFAIKRLTKSGQVS